MKFARVKFIHPLISAFNHLFKIKIVGSAIAFSMFCYFYISYYIVLAFNEPLYTDVDNYKFRYLVSNAIKEIPTFKPMENSIQFAFCLGHNSQIAKDSLMYRSNAPATEIISYYQLYFDIIKYRPIQEEQWTDYFIMYRNGSHLYYVIVREEQSQRNITIEHYV
jgi:hypothetical protein